MESPNPVYCLVRQRIEQRGWVLASRLHEASERLMDLIGVDRAQFASAKTACGDLRQQINDCRTQLLQHRCDHKC